MQREIGGYIEFEYYSGSLFHEKSLKLNCARNCLAYLIKAYDIKKIYIPYFLCDSVWKICKKYGVEFNFYHIDENFLPIIPDVNFSKDWLYVVNYYGQVSNDKIKLLSHYINNLIVDNVQSFFQMPVNSIPTLYSCRKFFGVTDGAYLYTEKKLNEKILKDISYKRMEFLFGRFEKTANEFYPQYVANNDLFENETIKEMSPLTENILRSLDYESIQNARTENFLYLNKHFQTINKLNLSIPKGAFAYPLYVENGSEIRKKLQKKRIYIPTLWADTFDVCKENDLEYKYSKNILPLPLDQRYGKKEMNYIVNTFLEVF